jgi:putative transposase
LNLRRKKNKRIKSARNRKPTDSISSECWSMDFMSDALFDGKRFRLLTLVDNYSRKCLPLRR